MTQEQRIRPKRRRFPQEVYDAAQELLNEEPTPSAAMIADRLADAFPDHPSDRAVSDWIARGVIARDDQDGPWSLTDAKPEDIPLVLEIARSLIEASADKKWRARHPNWPTKAVAKWIVRLRRAYPDLEDPIRTYQLAHMARHSDGRWVQTTLAFTPWRDKGEALNRARRLRLLPKLDEDEAVRKLDVTMKAFG